MSYFGPNDARQWLEVGQWYENEHWGLTVKCVEKGDPFAYFEEPGGSGDKLSYAGVAVLKESGGFSETSAP